MHNRTSSGSEVTGTYVPLADERYYAIGNVDKMLPFFISVVSDSDHWILSDDGLQHYALRRDIEIAVCRYLALGNGLMLPAGPLREPRSRLQRVDITINRDSDQIIESIGEVWNLSRPEKRRHISDFQGFHKRRYLIYCTVMEHDWRVLSQLGAK